MLLDKETSSASEEPPRCQLCRSARDESIKRKGDTQDNQGSDAHLQDMARRWHRILPMNLRALSSLGALLTPTPHATDGLREHKQRKSPQRQGQVCKQN